MRLHVPTVETVYLNLDSRSDRDESMRALLSGLAFERVSRLSATLAENRDRIPAACALSHRRALDTVPDDEPLLVLEDDCVAFEPREWVDVPDDADLLFLGVSRFPTHVGSAERKERFAPAHEAVPSHPGVFRSRGMMLSHAVLYLSPLGRSYMRAVLDHAAWINGPHDFYVTESLFTVTAYALDRPFFAQTSQLVDSWGSLSEFHPADRPPVNPGWPFVSPA
jgi:GR25 family glycosyltransferase involved in LPS biosynthesis